MWNDPLRSICAISGQARRFHRISFARLQAVHQHSVLIPERIRKYGRGNHDFFSGAGHSMSCFLQASRISFNKTVLMLAFAPGKIASHNSRNAACSFSLTSTAKRGSVFSFLPNFFVTLYLPTNIVRRITEVAISLFLQTALGAIFAVRLAMRVQMDRPARLCVNGRLPAPGYCPAYAASNSDSSLVNASRRLFLLSLIILSKFGCSAPGASCCQMFARKAAASDARP